MHACMYVMVKTWLRSEERSQSTEVSLLVRTTRKGSCNVCVFVFVCVCVCVQKEAAGSEKLHAASH